MGNYQVMLWTNALGIPRIGIRYCRKEFLETQVDCERVYGTQIPCRVVAKTPHGHKIMTPTRARREGLSYQKFN